MDEGFGKLSQLRTDDEVAADARRTAQLLNSIISELRVRGIDVKIEVDYRHVKGSVLDAHHISLSITKAL